jgi:prepilin-type N-terminal cleavage/methylation domain-containing protein
MAPSRRTYRRGFTLIEMVVVIAMILLIAGAALPSVLTLFSAGADKQTVNLLAAQLAECRSMALTRGTHTALHIQPADATVARKNANQCYVTFFYLDPNGVFVPEPSYNPKTLPGSIAIGDIDGPTLQADGSYDMTGPKRLAEFQTVTLVFSPNGQLVTHVRGESPRFSMGDSDAPAGSPYRSAHLLWRTDSDPLADPGGNSRALWLTRDDDGDDKITESVADGASTAVVIYNLADINALAASGDWQGIEDILNESGLYVAINRYTGEMYPRERKPEE